MDQITQAQVEAAQLQPEPIPAGWVLSGAPQARAAELSRSPDGGRVNFLWDCTAGEYVWRYASHETIEILEGEAIVDDGNGSWRSEPNPAWRERTADEIDALIARQTQPDHA